MQRESLQAIFAALALAAIASACQGAGFAPPASQAVYSTMPAAPNVSAPLSRLGLGAAMPDKIPACNAPVVGVPGTYISWIAIGNVKMGTFKATQAASEYFVLKYAKATPPPSPSPTASPTTGPTPPPMYYYYGTYTLKRGKGGCAYLLTTVNGKPFKGTKYNGTALGSPRVAAKYYNTTFVSYGPMTMTVKHLSASGGRGSFVLLKSGGGTYNTGNVTFTGRVQYP